MELSCLLDFSKIYPSGKYSRTVVILMSRNSNPHTSPGNSLNLSQAALLNTCYRLPPAINLPTRCFLDHVTLPTSPGVRLILSSLIANPLAPASLSDLLFFPLPPSQPLLIFPDSIQAHLRSLVLMNIPSKAHTARLVFPSHAYFGHLWLL